jgi:hypothetical protein
MEKPRKRPSLPPRAAFTNDLDLQTKTLDFIFREPFFSMFKPLQLSNDLFVQTVKAWFKILDSLTSPKLKNINELYKLNKNDALMPKKVLDQVIEYFKFHPTNWV